MFGSGFGFRRFFSPKSPPNSDRGAEEPFKCTPVFLFFWGLLRHVFRETVPTYGWVSDV